MLSKDCQVSPVVIPEPFPNINKDLSDSAFLQNGQVNLIIDTFIEYFNTRNILPMELLLPQVQSVLVHQVFEESQKKINHFNFIKAFPQSQPALKHPVLIIYHCPGETKMPNYRLNSVEGP